MVEPTQIGRYPSRLRRHPIRALDYEGYEDIYDNYGNKIGFKYFKLEEG